MERNPNNHISYFVAYSKIGVLFRFTNDDIQDNSYDKMYIPNLINPLMIRKEVDPNSDGKLFYWPYFNVPIKVSNENNDEFNVAVVGHQKSNKIIFYMKRKSLEDINLFSFVLHNYVKRNSDDDISPKEFIQLLINVVNI